ncbi:hypothetical protein K9N68_14620 [Kovacikia minuta CCNUW1]|nr:hypothetical protein [Kovacikia minuta]UBF28960.1 hypothetical protein K9N68_14620 [Kovacikia minuta CCNUW1]
MLCTPQKTVELIHQQGNDYVITVKANQKTLYQQLQALAQSDEVVSVHLDSETTRSRQTTRIASVFPLPDAFKDQWSGAQQGVEVIRCGHRQGQPYLEHRYYITSWTDKADAFARAHSGSLGYRESVALGQRCGAGGRHSLHFCSCCGYLDGVDSQLVDYLIPPSGASLDYNCDRPSQKRLFSAIADA